jgi:hypothetical protein
MIKGITERLGKRRGLATKQLGQIVPVGRKVAGTQQGRGRARQQAARGACSI